MKTMLQKLSFISLISLLVLTVFPTQINAQEIVQSQLGDRGFKNVEDLGPAAYSVAITSAVFGEIEGVTHSFVVANGGILNVVNAENNKLVYNTKIDNLNTVWSHALTTDGILYIAGLDFENKGVLYAYNIKTHEIVNHGNILPNHQFWSTALDENNNLYVGTYLPGSNGSVFKFDHKSKVWTNLGVVLPGTDADYVRSMSYHEGSLYLGIGLQGRMIKMDLSTGKKTNLSDGAYDIIGRPLEETKEVPAAVQSVEGNQVLATFDNSGVENVAIATKPINVEEMKNYEISAQVNLTGRNASFYVRFFDKDNKQITAGENVKQVDNGVGKWELVTLTGSVPTNAVTLTINMGSTGGRTNSGAFFDDLKLVNADTKVAMHIENAGFEQGTGKTMPGFVAVSTTTVAVDYYIQNNVSIQTISGEPTLKFLYDMAIIDDLLIARFDADYRNIVMFFNLETQTWENVKYEDPDSKDASNQGAFGWNTLQEINGKTYLSFNYELNELDLETLELKPVIKTDGTTIPYKTGFRGFGVIDRTKMVTAVRAGYLQVFDTETNTLENKEVVMQATPLTLHNLAKDNNGDLYLTTYPGGPRGAKFDISEGEFTSYAQGQAEGIVAGKGNDIYFGFYPGASIQVMDTESMTTETLFNLKDTYGQDRPYIMEFLDDKLYIGTIPDYGKLGSTLTIYDPETGEKVVYKDPIKDQSIVGIAKVGNKLIVSTSIHGGLQTTPTADEAVIFLFDLETGKVIKEVKLDIPGLGKTPHISGLTVDADGTVWGIADGIIFTLDPETLEVTKYKDVYPDVRNYGRWRPMNIEFGEGGLLYANIGGNMTVIDPSTKDWDHIAIKTKPIQFFTLSENEKGQETLYILEDAATNMIRVEIVEGGIVERQPITSNVNVDVDNLNFENGLEGWTMLGGTDEKNTSISSSTEMKSEGNASLKITDTTASNMIFAESPRIPVVAGEKYFSEVDLHIESGMTSMYLRFYDENGKQTNKDLDGENIMLTRGSDRGWVKVRAEVVAPEGSVYAIVGLGTSNFAETPGAYYDDLKVYTQVVTPPVEGAIQELSELIDTIVEEIEKMKSEDYTLESWNNYLAAVEHAKDIIARFNAPITRMRVVNTRPTLLEVELAIIAVNEAKAALTPVTLVVPPVPPVTPAPPVTPVVPPVSPVTPVIPPVSPVTPVIPPVTPETPVIQPVTPETDEKLPSTGVMSTPGTSLTLVAAGVYLSRKKKEN